MKISASRAPKWTRGDFPFPVTGFRIAAWNDESLAEKTWIWSVLATRMRDDEGAQARVVIGPEKSAGSFTTWTVCNDWVERTTMVDDDEVAMSLPSGLALHCGEAVDRAC